MVEQQAFDVVADRHESCELVRALQQLLGVLVEQIEEPPLARHESPEHAYTSWSDAMPAP